MKNFLSKKLYYSISEVAELTDLQPYTLRAWEKEFSCLRPRRVRGKNRAYRLRDICIVLMIRQLLHEERYTIQGVRQKIKCDPELLRRVVENFANCLYIQNPEGGGQAPSSPSRPASADGPQIQIKDKKAGGHSAQTKGQDQNALREVIKTAREALNDILDLI